MELGWIDTHAHLVVDELLIDIDDVIERAKNNGVMKIIVIAMNGEEIEIAKNLKRKYPMLEIAGGFHPSDAHLLSENDWKKLENSLKQGELIAIGEIGLDYYWDKSHVDVQKEVFKRQLTLAKKYHLPVLIHTREATEDTFNMIVDANLNDGGIMHCYTGSVEMAERYINKGFFISLAGPLTFKNANLNKEVARALPLDKIFVETDSPYLSPEPKRGKRNESAFVKYTGEEVARLRNIEISELQSQMLKNFHSLFK